MLERLQLRVFISSVQKELASKRLALQILLTTDPSLQQYSYTEHAQFQLGGHESGLRHHFHKLPSQFELLPMANKKRGDGTNVQSAETITGADENRSNYLPRVASP